MASCSPRITYDSHHVPGLCVADPAEAHFGIGVIHGRHRPLQTLLIHTAASGLLVSRLFQHPSLSRMDALVSRLAVPELARATAKQLDATTQMWLQHYAEGVAHGLRNSRGFAWGHLVGSRLCAPSVQSILGTLLLSAYVGQAEGQERMERALVACVRADADLSALSALFKGLVTPEALEPIARTKVDPGLSEALFVGPGGAGSNAWAVGGGRSTSGLPLLAGDPHLPVGELPSALCPVRIGLPDDFWLGATLPGLPGLFVGRNKTLAYSGTFAFADTVDLVIEERTSKGEFLRRDGAVAPPRVEGSPSSKHGGTNGPSGPLDDAHAACTLSPHWFGAHKLAESMACYLRLPLARDVAAFDSLLDDARTLSLTFVAADRTGRVLKRQTGAGVRRSEGRSGLSPVLGRHLTHHPFEVDHPVAHPKNLGDDRALFVSANDGCIEDALAGIPGHTLVQPPYRKQRIYALLEQTQRHDIHSFCQIQCDITSLQAALLIPRMLLWMGDGEASRLLAAWDHRYAADSRAAATFETLLHGMYASLAPWLGEEVWLRLLSQTETALWWCRALDAWLFELLGNETIAPPLMPCRRAVREQLAHMTRTPLPTPSWGERHALTLRHAILGIPLRPSHRARGWPGSVATISQATLIPKTPHPIAIGPAFRFVCDLATATLAFNMPGGLDERPWSPLYANFVDDWHTGRMRTLACPSPSDLP